MTEHDSDGRDADANRRTILRGVAATGFGGGLVTLANRTSGRSEGRKIVIRAAERATVRYTFRVTGSVERGPAADRQDAVLGGTAAKGIVADGREDSFLFTGELQAIRLDGPGKAFVDGTLVKDTTGTLPNRITVEAGEKPVAYEFSVTGRVERGSESEDEDRIDDGTVKGRLGPGDADTYRYSGSITVAETEEPLTVTLELNAGT